MSLWTHNSTEYQDVLDRINELSRLWNTPQMLRTRPEFERIWTEIEARRTFDWPRMVVAHHLADLQTNPHQEYEWDIRSLVSLAPIWLDTRDPRLYDAAKRSLPSIHLSLGGALTKMSCPDDAREHLRRARVELHWLPPCEYRDKVVRGIGHWTEVAVNFEEDGKPQ